MTDIELFDKVVKDISKLSPRNLVKLRGHINVRLHGDSILREGVVNLFINERKTKLECIKYVKDNSSWGLLESSNFCREIFKELENELKEPSW